MSRKRARSPSPTSPTSTFPKSHQFFHSPSINDRSSTFTALYSPTAPIKDLQTHADFKTASHRIAAWRVPSSQRTLAGTSRLYDCGHDDDGEQYAGKKLEKVLENLNVEGSIVVARWYGGVLLGPVRFSHIENCAREAIGKWKIENADKQRELHAARKRKIDDEKEREGLIRALGERDDSITVLRALLKEKAQSSSGNSSQGKANSISGNPTPTKQIEYSAMPLQALRQLDKARDATISWILREIEKVEEKDNSPADPS